MDSIEYYNKYAAKIYEDTVDVDMSEILNQISVPFKREIRSWIWDAAQAVIPRPCMIWV